MKYIPTILSCTIILSICCSQKALSQTYSQWLDKSADYMEVNQLDSAAYALQKAMAAEPANPHNTFLLMNLGFLQQQLGHLNEAYISLSASMTNNPDSLTALHSRAALLCQMERYDEAMDDYDTILQADTLNTEAYYRRGLLFLEKNNREQAQQDLLAAQQIDPENIFAQLSKALTLKLNDDWEAAEKIYTNLIRTERHFVSGYYLNRAECYVNSEQFSKAAADLQAVEPYEKQNPYFYFLRGRVRLEQYDRFAARQDFEKARTLGYDPAIANQWIAKSR